MSESEDLRRLLEPVAGPENMPPASLAVDVLPFEHLSWERFEKLCTRLFRELHRPNDVHLYGRPGQAQEGIDLYVTTPVGEVVVQCKRYDAFDAADFSKAVKKLHAGRWAAAVEKIIAVACDVSDKKVQDALTVAVNTAKTNGVVLRLWGARQLTDELRRFPALIDEFFGKGWVEQWNLRVPEMILVPVLTKLGGQPTRSFESAALAARQLGFRPTRTLRGPEILADPPLDDLSSWSSAVDAIEGFLKYSVASALEETPAVTLGIFPLSRVSLLFAFGIKLGNACDARLFRWDRDKCTWLWADESPEYPTMTVLRPDLPTAAKAVCLALSISQPVQRDTVKAAMAGNKDYAIWEITVPDPKLNRLHSPDELAAFKELFRDACTEIQQAHGDDIELHLFPGVPAPHAVAMGQTFLTRARPSKIHLYEYASGTQVRVLTL